MIFVRLPMCCLVLIVAGLNAPGVEAEDTFPRAAIQASLTSHDAALSAAWDQAVETARTRLFEGRLPLADDPIGLETATLLRAYLWLTGDVDLPREFLEQTRQPEPANPFGPNRPQNSTHAKLAYPILLNEYFEYTGGAEFSRWFADTMFPELFSTYAAFEDERGLLARSRIPDWPEDVRYTVDGEVAEGEPDAMLNAVYYASLRAAAELRTKLGVPDVELETKAGNLLKAYQAWFFDAHSGLFRVTPYAGQTSIAVNGMALYAGLVPSESVPKVIEYIVQRGLNASPAFAPYVVEGVFNADTVATGYQLLTGPRVAASDAGSVYLIGEHIMGLHIAEPGWRRIAAQPGTLPVPLTSMRVPLTDGWIAASREPDNRMTVTTAPDVGVEVTPGRGQSVVVRADAASSSRTKLAYSPPAPEAQTPKPQIARAPEPLNEPPPAAEAEPPQPSTPEPETETVVDAEDNSMDALTAQLENLASAVPQPSENGGAGATSTNAESVANPPDIADDAATSAASTGQPPGGDDESQAGAEPPDSPQAGVDNQGPRRNPEKIAEAHTPEPTSERTIVRSQTLDPPAPAPQAPEASHEDQPPQAANGENVPESELDQPAAPESPVPPETPSEPEAAESPETPVHLEPLIDTEPLDPPVQVAMNQLTPGQWSELQTAGWSQWVATGIRPVVWVNVDEQMLRVIENGQIMWQTPCATSARGVGMQMHSLKTPLGWHSVAYKVGEDAPWGRVFRARQPTNELWKPGDDTTEDMVLTRVLVLTGEEPGINKGGTVDSMSRHIYIHGTNDEARIGTPSSHGCVRLTNDDVITAFDMIPEGALVLITSSQSPDA